MMEWILGLSGGIDGARFGMEHRKMEGIVSIYIHRFWNLLGLPWSRGRWSGKYIFTVFLGI